MQACGIWTCFGLLDVVFESPVLVVGVRLIHRHILEPSLGLLFVHRVRNAGRCELTVAGVRYVRRF